MIKIGHHRRFTANHTFHVDIPGHALFLKLSPNPREAAAEAAGHQRLSPHYPVPRFWKRIRFGRWTLLVYDRVDNRLLLDEINRADLTGDLTRLDECLDDIYRHYRTAVLATVVRAPLSATVDKLYGDRARPGGRLDQYYGKDPLLAELAGLSLRMTNLGGSTILVNGRPATIDYPRLRAWLGRRFHPGRREWTAITQGDPTDVNLGWTREAGPIWFDYDTAGRNALPGEFACFLWYQHLHGGWIVPTYNSAAFADHPDALTLRTRNQPTVHIERQGNHSAIDVRHAPSLARQHTIRRYLHEIVQPIAAELGIDNLLAWLRPWLVMRILAVYHLGVLAPTDAVLHLAYLARVLDPDATLEQLLTDQTAGVP